MTKYTTLASIAVIGLMAATSLTMMADERDKKTVITTKETLMVPGKVLPPGTYVMKLSDSSSNRHIVMIYNEKQDQLQTMFIAFPNYKLRQTSGTTLTFWETPAGSPRAVRAWFWPGDTSGQEFAYPKQMAETLARENNNAKVPSYDAANDTTLTESQLAELKVSDIPETDSTAATHPAETSSNSVNTPEPVRQETAAIRTPEPVVTQSAQTTTAQTTNDTLLAQNTPAPSVINDNSSANTTTATTPSELPQTASPLSWVLLTGLASFATAITMRQLRA